MIQALVYGNGSQETERAVMVLEACDQDVKEFKLGLDFTHNNSKQNLAKQQSIHRFLLV